MARVPLRPDALPGLNLLYQRYNTWITTHVHRHRYGYGYGYGESISNTNTNNNINSESGSSDILIGSITSFYVPVLVSINKKEYHYKHSIEPRIISDVDTQINTDANNEQLRMD